MVLIALNVMSTATQPSILMAILVVTTPATSTAMVGRMAAADTTEQFAVGLSGLGFSLCSFC
jgi:hypothetical protein